MIWTIVNALGGTLGRLDEYGRPVTLFNRTVHDQCERRGRQEARMFGQDGLCLEELGCHGPDTKAPCPITRFNNGVNWCVDANALCIGCTNPKFPGEKLHEEDD
jgi:hydrogenase small subunit